MRFKDFVKHGFGPAGGFAYHLLALRRHKKSWAPFRADVRAWFLEFQKAWPEGIDELVIFGASAGWTLPLEELRSLKMLTIVEPDPVARFLLKKRLRKRNVQFISNSTLLPWFAASEGHFETFLNEHPRAAILFSNLLGQVSLLLPRVDNSEKVKAPQKEFLTALKSRTWASYHDLYSAVVEVTRVSKLSPSDIPPLKNVNEIRERLEKIASDAFPAATSVTDHETTWLSEGRETRLALWPISDTQTHIIGFVKSVST